MVYRLAPAVAARLVGLALLGLVVALVAGTALVALAGLSPAVLVVLVAGGVAGCAAFGWWLHRRAWVLRCSAAGYRVRMVRGAGEHAARWAEVEDAVTTTRHGVACVVLRLRDGRTTTIPVGVLDVDREQFVRDLRVRLQHGHGLRPA